VEILIVVGIIGVIASIALIATNPARKRARDAKRKFELAQIGRFLAGTSCYQPTGGPGEYDLALLYNEITTKNPQIKQMIAKVPRDPRGGSDTETFYTYLLSADGKKCALYANLENENEEITIKGLTDPTPGGGSGVLEGSTEGHNGTRIYFQSSN
jgi:type II secretory pathway pseudopilin PulG